MIGTEGGARHYGLACTAEESGVEIIGFAGYMTPGIEYFVNPPRSSPEGHTRGSGVTERGDFEKYTAVDRAATYQTPPAAGLCPKPVHHVERVWC